MKHLASVLLLLTIFLSSAVAAKNNDSGDTTGLALVGGRLIDGFGGPPITNSVILIKDNLIETIGTTKTLVVPDDYRVISTEGMDVLPGLWETHAHISLGGHGNYKRWFGQYGGRLIDEIVPAYGEQFLLAGVTTVRDLGGDPRISLQARENFNSGKFAGPRLFVAGPFIQNKSAGVTSFGRWAVTGRKDAEEKVNKLADMGVDFIKMIDHDRMTFEEAQAVVNTAHDRGLIVSAHGRRPAEVRRGLEIGIDNFEHAGQTTAPAYSTQLLNMIQERTAQGEQDGKPLYWTPTVNFLYNYERMVSNPEFIDDECWQRGLSEDIVTDIKLSLKNPGQLDHSWLNRLRAPSVGTKVKQLYNSGVVLLVGTDSGIPLNFHCQTTVDEIAALTHGIGIPTMDIIRGATYWPAQLMGVFDKWGSVSEGKYADIIAVKGDVLTYPVLLKNVDIVIKDGTVFKQHGIPVEKNFSRADSDH